MTCPSKAIFSNLLLSHHNVRGEVGHIGIMCRALARFELPKGRPNFPSHREEGFMQSGNREPKLTLMDQPDWAQEAGFSQALNF